MGADPPGRGGLTAPATDADLDALDPTMKPPAAAASVAAAPRTAARPELLGVTLGFQAFVFVAWELASRSGVMPPYVLGPLAIAGEAVASLGDGETLGHAARSLFRVYAGFAIGAGIGVVLGLLAGVNGVVRHLLDTPQAFVHALPKVSLFPAVAVWLGFTDPARILIIALSCFFPAYLNAMSGALGLNPKYLWLARNNEIGRARTFWQVVLPAALPRTLVGLRISLMVAFILMVATEVVGHSDGLGSRVMHAYHDGNYLRMYAAIVLIALAGFVSNAVLQRLSARACRGQELELKG